MYMFLTWFQFVFYSIFFSFYISILLHFIFLSNILPLLPSLNHIRQEWILLHSITQKTNCVFIRKIEVKMLISIFFQLKFWAGHAENIQGDQNVYVHLKITVHHQVNRDFLITLYICMYSESNIFVFKHINFLKSNKNQIKETFRCFKGVKQKINIS
jgi:hypothetical protein